MTGLLIRVPGTTDDPDAPLFRHDAILPEAGALLLIDPAHSGSAAVTLANNAPLTNIAAGQAAALAEADEADVHAELRFSNITTAGNDNGMIELSGKGGIHTIISESATVSTDAGMVIRPDQAIVDYLIANPNNDYYVSIWFYLSRPGEAGQAYSAVSLSAVASATELLYSLANYQGTIYPTGANKIGGASDPAQLQPSMGGEPGPVFMNVGVSAYTGTPTRTGANAQTYFKVFGVGDAAPFNNDAGGYPSAVFYRAYMEDLTVSGRTYGEVTLLDIELFERDVKTSGGRYHGDTFTDPDTIP